MSKLGKIRLKLQHSIYGQVVFTILILSFFLFAAVGVIFRSVNEAYLDSVIHLNGANIGSIVEGSLYHSMLTNDRSSLENTLDVINDLPGIEDINLYDGHNNLVYAAFGSDSTGHDNPDCKSCHNNLEQMFPEQEKSFRIVNIDSQCEMSRKNYDNRLLLIRSPILNEQSCYTSACHAHTEQEKVLGSFVIRIPLEDLDRSVNKSYRDFFLLAAFTTLLLTVFLIFFTRRKIRDPLGEIVKASEAVSKGNNETRLRIDDGQLNDIRMVSTAFNEMLDNLQAANDELLNWSNQLEYKVQKKSEELSEMQNELIHVERIASLGKLSSSVAHEINNPLSGVLTYTKLVQKQLERFRMDAEEKDPMMKYLKVIEEETKRCGEIVKGLLDFSRKDQVDFKHSHLHKLLREAHTLIDHQLKMSNINFFTDFKATRDTVLCSENQIKQACIAILMNASEAVSDNGEIVMRTSNQGEDYIFLEISDNGSGISADDLPHVFEPFFSAKEKASGIGLGLAIVHGIISSHKGKVEVVSQPGKGTTVSILLPLIKSNQK